jgi:hypothetical protein
MGGQLVVTPSQTTERSFTAQLTLPEQLIVT